MHFLVNSGLTKVGQCNRSTPTPNHRQYRGALFTDNLNTRIKSTKSWSSCYHLHTSVCNSVCKLVIKYSPGKKSVCVYEWVCWWVPGWRMVEWFLTSNVEACCYSVTQSFPTLCDPMDCSMPAFSVLHHPPELSQTHVHWGSKAIQSSHPLLSPSPSAFSLSHHWGLF